MQKTNFFYRIENQLKNIKTSTTILIFTIIILIQTFILGCCFGLLVEEIDVDNKEYSSIINLIFLALIIAPLIETFINQYLFFKIFYKVKTKIIIIIISAIMFSLLHYHKNVNIFELFTLFFNGIIFSYAYYFYLKYNKSAYINVVLIHLFSNLIPVMYLIINPPW
jgi:membrane protease YdiL (CAAX protease family)